MKQIFSVIVLFILATSLACSQSQKITVMTQSADSDVLRYAYIYINNEPYSTSNKFGEAHIPISMLKKGDVISASYTGYERDSIIYSGYNKDGLVIKLTPQQIGTVRIYTQEETRKQYSYTDPYLPLARALDYTATVIVDVNGEEYVRGIYHHSFVPGYLESYDPRSALILPHSNLYMELPDSTIYKLNNQNFVDSLKTHILPVIQNIYYAASRSVISELQFIDVLDLQLRKTGEDGRLRYFTVTRNGDGNSFDKVINSAASIKVDTLKNIIKEASINILRQDDRMEIKAKYAVFDVFRYPNVVEGTFFSNDGTVYSMVILNVRPSYKFKVGSLKGYNSVKFKDNDNELVYVYFTENPKIAKVLKHRSNSAIWPRREYLEMLALANSMD